MIELLVIYVFIIFFYELIAFHICKKNSTDVSLEAYLSCFHLFNSTNTLYQFDPKFNEHLVYC